MIHTLPPLPYATDALEPKMSQETINYHYGKHAQGYVDKLNTLLADTPYLDMSLEELILNTSGILFNNAAQVWNHIFFFESLTPDSSEMPEELRKAIERDFGSVERFKKDLEAAAVALFGSGWIWLAQDKEGRLHIISEPNAGNPIRAGYKPLMAVDVWEHAYYIDYRNRRSDFVRTVWDLTDWKKVEMRMKGESSTESDADAKARYVCDTCGWIYDPETGDPDTGIAPGTSFKDIPPEWTCPACGVGKELFVKER